MYNNSRGLIKCNFCRSGNVSILSRAGLHIHIKCHDCGLDNASQIAVDKQKQQNEQYEQEHKFVAVRRRRPKFSVA